MQVRRLVHLALVGSMVMTANCLLTSNFDGLSDNYTSSSTSSTGSHASSSSGGPLGGGGGSGGTLAMGGAGGTTAPSSGGSTAQGGAGGSGGAGGAGGGCGTHGVGAAFPSQCVLDAFNRPDGAPGANWLLEHTGIYAIASNRLVTSAPTMTTINPETALWTQFLGPDQEVYVTLVNFTPPDSEIELLLKAQAGAQECDALNVSYHQGTLDGYKCESSGGGFIALGPGFIVGFSPGDQLGARATASGDLYGYRNGTQVAHWLTTSFSAYKESGRVGVYTSGIHESLVFDDFGGGSD